MSPFGYPTISAGPFSVFPGMPGSSAPDWRFRIAGQLDSTTQFDCISMMSVSGGANLCVGQTAVYGAATGTWLIGTPFVPDGAESNITGGTPLAITTRWFGCNFSSPVSIVEMALTADNQAAGPRPSTPQALYLQRSLDGRVTWQTMGIYAGVILTSGETRAFPVGSSILGTGRANAYTWRVRVTATNGGATLEIIQIELRDSGGTNLATGGGACGSRGSTYGLNNGSFGSAWDGNVGTWWGVSGGTSMDEWTCYTVGTPPSIATLAMTARGETTAPRDFVLEYTNDLDTWTNALTVSNSTGWGANETRTWAVP